jgi:hypothetical protein
MKNILTIIPVFFLHFCICEAQYLSIKGEFTNNTTDTILILKKYNNILSQNYIKNLKIRNHSFEDSVKVLEPDTYILSTESGDNAFVFVWDASIKLVIDNNDLSMSKIYGSPLSLEYLSFTEERFKKYIKPMKDLEKEFNKFEYPNKSIKSKIDSLNIIHSKLFREGIEGFQNYGVLYALRNPNSFVSLLIITQDEEDKKREEYISIYKMLPEYLKKHSRAAIFR